VADAAKAAAEHQQRADEEAALQQVLDRIPKVEATWEELQAFIGVVKADIEADGGAVWKAHAGVPSECIIKRFGSWKRLSGLTNVQMKLIAASEATCRKAFTFKSVPDRM
jgi:hypothetical protein